MKPEHGKFPLVGFLKLACILRCIPVSKTAWYEGVKSGIYHAPIKLGKRSSAYRVEDIRKLIEELGESK
jgi:predicted DNA-binding transcriptional regulator AlpA